MLAGSLAQNESCALAQSSASAETAAPARLSAPAQPRPRQPSAAGKVWLVGAGPGDPDLLTIKAARILGQADVWLIDDLVGPGILALAAPGTRMVKVGKRGGCRSTPQDFILRLMARYARQGRSVARVKGGDPFIFGRGGEEMAWLAARGIAAEAVGGQTAGLAAGAALGLPLTHRGVSRGVALVTAHTMDGSRPDWRGLAASGLTVVCYMGMNDADSLARECMAAGFAADLPVAVVHRVSCPDQRHVVTTLAEMATAIVCAGLQSPAVIVLGEVVALMETTRLPAAIPCPQAAARAA
ncbi:MULTISPECIES: uroporphyrinogen-III C-methyltransferase [unclassified Achromobacter]|uniref:uroporphyrinogen-III C-methyltransferase n=1 Tax=unclassified Achromobacter TaxID=2626865 RepID=UPI0021015DE6|nr:MULTISPECIES: uroporphyrinogen-III C-methyltransferase [unclassified Achromobacter]